MAVRSINTTPINSWVTAYSIEDRHKPVCQIDSFVQIQLVVIREVVGRKQTA